MTEPADPTGFEVRKAAVQRLNHVLSGAPFVPFETGNIADPRARALANRLVTASLKRHGHIGLVLSRILKKGVPPRSGLFEASTRLAVAQLLYLPEICDHAAIYLAVEIIKKDRRASRFAKLANAVLRRVQKDFQEPKLPLENLAPSWMVARWQKHYGSERTTSMLRAILEYAPLDLSFKPGHAGGKTAPDVINLTGNSARVRQRDRPVSELPGYAGGSWWVQDFAASLPVSLAKPVTGQSALDICAAPGGKTAQLAAAGAHVVALDNDRKRMRRLTENLDRLDLDARLIIADAGDFSMDEQFDLVVLDAPCSATGTYRRHPEVIWNRTRDDVLRFVESQRKMLHNSARLVKPGGMLVFCTCSLEPEEGEHQARNFLERYGQDFQLVPVERHEVGGNDDFILGDGFLRTLPGMAVPDTEGSLDGFFAARFTRRA